MAVPMKATPKKLMKTYRIIIGKVVASGIIRLKMSENHWIKIENGNMKIKLPPIRRQSHLCIKIALRTEVNIPKTMKAQKRVIELFPKTAIPRLFSAAVQ